MGCSAKQYTDIYDANQALLSGDRSAARQALASAELDDAFAADYGLNLNRVALPVNVADSFRCGVPTVSTAMALVVNDTFAPTARLDERLPQGVRFMSLGDAMRECPQLVTPHLHVADGDPLTQLNDLLVQDGVFIYIPRGVRLQRPLQLVNIFSAPIDLMAVRRVVIVVEEGAEGKLLVCDHTQDRSRRYLGLQLVQISLADGAAFQLHDIEESSPLTARRYSLRCRLAAHSSLRLSVSTLSGGDTANDIRIDLDGDGAEAVVNGMAITDGTQRASNATTVRHHGEHTHSDQLFKYVADGESRGEFRGSIVVDESARFTEAYQTNRNILASDTARMHTEPTLEIYCDEVKCSHGAATGQLDPQALFYMRTRGIPEDTARHMLMEAFMADVIDSIGIEGLRERMRMLVERRFSGIADARCADCGASTTTCVSSPLDKNYD